MKAIIVEKFTNVIKNRGIALLAGITFKVSILFTQSEKAVFYQKTAFFF